MDGTTVMALPWWMYPADSAGGGYQEMTDPMGNYLKPDTNIAVPAGTPITAWDSGVITDISNRGRTLAGLSVTMKLAHPPNAQAQYASFNYLGNALVHVGQSISPGSVIGTAGSPTGVNFALALGVSPQWGAQCPQCSSKQPNLDPRIILNALKAGTSPLGTGAQYFGSDLVGALNGDTVQSATQCAPWDFQCILQSAMLSDVIQRASILFFGIMLLLVGVIVLFVGKGGIQKTNQEVASGV